MTLLEFLYNTARLDKNVGVGAFLNPSELMDVTPRTDKIAHLASADALVAMFDAGRRFNELRWESDQSVVLRSADRNYVSELIQWLARKIADLQPTIEGAGAAWNEVLAIQSEWKGWTDSEDFAEDYFSCLEQFEDRLQSAEFEPVKHAFEARLERASRFRDRIRTLLESGIGDFEEPKIALLLGETIDQAIRPPDFIEHLHREFPNPNRL